MTITKEPQGETWLIDDNPYKRGETLNVLVNFTSNGQNFKRLYIYDGGRGPYANDPIMYGINETQDPEGVDIIAYSGSTPDWTNQAYRTVTFETTPTGQLLTWLQENAVKQ